jgi:hypothetical protein
MSRGESEVKNEYGKAGSFRGVCRDWWQDTFGQLPSARFLEEIEEAAARESFRIAQEQAHRRQIELALIGGWPEAQLPFWESPEERQPGS